MQQMKAQQTSAGNRKPANILRARLWRRPRLPGRHDPCFVANYFIGRALQDQRPLTPLQVNKLVFLAHVWTLGLHRRPLINQQFEAWPYGPISPAVYHNLSYYGGEPVTAPVLARDNGPFKPHEASVLSQTYDLYAHLTGEQLSAICRAPGGPWDSTRRRSKRRVTVPDGLIEKYFHRAYLQSLKNQSPS